MRKLLLYITLLACGAISQAQTVTVSGSLKSIFGAAAASRVKVCFTLILSDGQEPADPHVAGSGILIPTRNDCSTTVSGSGTFSTTVFANDQIVTAGIPNTTLWSVQYLYNGVYAHGGVYQFLLADITEDLTSKSPVNVSPSVITVPTDTVYARIDGGNQPFLSGINACRIGTMYIAGSSCYTTVQAAITAACSATPAGGKVYIPTGSFPQNTPFILCSNLNILGSGRCQVDATNCPSMITTTMTSGDLFPITNMTDISLADFGIKNTAAAGANAAIRLNYGQRVVVQRIYISGLFARGLELDTSSTSTGSTIRNHFEDIFMTGLAPSSIGCLLNSSDATTKVINNNRFIMVGCQGGTGAAVGLKVTNSNATQNINENLFYGDQFSTTDGSSGAGIGIQFTSTATRGMVFESSNVESNGTGLNKATANTVTFLGGNFSSNGTQVVDAQPTFTQFLGTNVQGIVQQFEILPVGGMNVDGIGIKAAPDSGNINGLAGWVLEASGTTVATINSANFTLNKPGNLVEQTAPAGTIGNTLLWADSTAHRLKMNNNNVVADIVVGATSTDTLTNKTLGGVGTALPHTIANRIRASGGTAVTTADFVLNGSWGSTATKNAVTGTDMSGSISITANGAGIVANPVATFTFHDGAWPSKPTCVLGRNDAAGIAAGVGVMVGDASSTTTANLVFFATPSAGNTYIITWVCM